MGPAIGIATGRETPSDPAATLGDTPSPPALTTTTKEQRARSLVPEHTARAATDPGCGFGQCVEATAAVGQ
ncbi:hypothetical protein V3N99_13230 [Dermatophilaceae bacterium Soc4.6]